MQEPKAKEIFCFCLVMRNIHHILYSRKPRKLYIIENFLCQLFSLKCILVCECLYIVKDLSGEYLTLQNVFYVVRLCHILDISKVDKKINLELEIIIITNYVMLQLKSLLNDDDDIELSTKSSNKQTNI
jgi:hypothetical protein